MNGDIQKDMSKFCECDLFETRILAKAIKLRVLSGDHPGLCGWILNPITNVLISDRRGRQGRGGHGKTKAETRASQPHTRELRSHQKAREARKDSSLEPLEGAWPCQLLEFGFPVPRL